MPDPSKLVNLDEVRHLLFEEGDWDAALSLAKSLVVNAPSDLSGRILLLSLFLFDNDLDRAGQQLKTYFTLSGENFSPDYISLISALEKREKVFRGVEKPHLLSDEPQWLERLLTLYTRGVGESADELSELTEEILPQLLETRWSLSGKEVTGIANYDTRTPSIIEGLFEGEYTWLLINDIEKLEIPQKPELLLDYVALPAQVTISGKDRRGFVFPLYFGSHSALDIKAKVGRMTEWEESAQDLNIGKGLQLFASGDTVVSLFELQDLKAI